MGEQVELHKYFLTNDYIDDTFSTNTKLKSPEKGHYFNLKYYGIMLIKLMAIVLISVGSAVVTVSLMKTTGDEHYKLDINRSFLSGARKNVTISDDNQSNVTKNTLYNVTKGEKGDKGDIGGRGQKGKIGLTGDKGAIGKKGTKGENGDKGLKGVKGTLGEKGLPGDQGQRGLTGLTGVKGQQGDKGVKGTKGTMGEKGLPGDKGLIGDIGKTGKTGPNGSKGIDGAKGETGDRGQPGEKGSKGEVGPTGNKGVTGDKGRHGDQGPIGGKGQYGDKGEQGDKGVQGSQGIKGQQGQKGQKGSKGTDGKNGRNMSCDRGWYMFGKYCYLFGKSGKNWNEAQSDCRAKNSNLIKIEDALENWFIKSMMNEIKNIPNCLWIGANDVNREGRWLWVSDVSSLAFLNWNSGEPNDSGRKEDCADVCKSNGYKWNDLPCYIRRSDRGYICKK